MNLSSHNTYLALPQLSPPTTPILKIIKNQFRVLHSHSEITYDVLGLHIFLYRSQHTCLFESGQTTQIITV